MGLLDGWESQSTAEPGQRVGEGRRCNSSFLEYTMRSKVEFDFPGCRFGWDFRCTSQERPVNVVSGPGFGYTSSAIVKSGLYKHICPRLRHAVIRRDGPLVECNGLRRMLPAGVCCRM